MTDNKKDVYDRNIALEWYEYGKDKDDFFFKFMVYWMAFNWLDDESPGYNERQKIREFCEEHYTQLTLYDPCIEANFSLQTFQKQPVNSAHGDNYSIAKKQFEVLTKANITQKWEQKKWLIALFLTMYQVRCNLFHGSKCLRDQWDVDLVQSSAIILEGYLKTLVPFNNA